MNRRALLQAAGTAIAALALPACSLLPSMRPDETWATRWLQDSLAELQDASSLQVSAVQLPTPIFRRLAWEVRGALWTVARDAGVLALDPVVTELPVAPSEGLDLERPWTLGPEILEEWEPWAVFDHPAVPTVQEPGGPRASSR